MTNRKSKGIAYVLWLVSIFGWLGFHRFYIRKYGTGLIWMFTFGVLGTGSLFDLFTLGTQVQTYNQGLELDQLRATSLANAEAQKQAGQAQQAEPRSKQLE